MAFVEYSEVKVAYDAFYAWKYALFTDDWSNPRALGYVREREKLTREQQEFLDACIDPKYYADEIVLQSMPD